jgi:hypothetical protein
MTSVPIEKPGTRFSPCGVYGCGDHGVCGTNNTCTCAPGWSGVHCHIAPNSPPDPALGDAECGNWGVYGSLTLAPSGLAPTCDCSRTGMLGDRCEFECEADSDCAHGGTCDSFGRCRCETSCTTDDHCGAGRVCDLTTRTCTGGWGDARCARALDSSCDNDEECGTGTCVGSHCQCPNGFTGKRCEFQLAGTGEACTYSSDCEGALSNETCVDDVCSTSGEPCLNSTHCRQICREGVCTYPGTEPVHTEAELDSIMKDMVDQLLSIDGVQQLAAEEFVEGVVGRAVTAVAAQRTLLYTLRHVTLRGSSKIGFEGMAAVKQSMYSRLKANVAFAAKRGGLTAAKAQ